METMEFIGEDIDRLMGEFMRWQDVAMLKEIIGEDRERVERLREEMTSSLVTEVNLGLDMASHYRRGVQLCMRRAYWRSMIVPEGSVFTDGSGCIWTAPDRDSEDVQMDMLAMRTSQDIPCVDLPNRGDESWLRAMGLLDALAHLQSY